MKHLPAVVWLVALVCVAPWATGQAPPGAAPAPEPARAAGRVWDFPRGTLAWWSVGPEFAAKGDDPARSAALLGLRAVLGRALETGQGGSMVVEELMSPSVIRDSSYRVVLLGVGVSRGRARGGQAGPLVIDDLKAVIEVRRSGSHEELVRALQAGLQVHERHVRREGRAGNVAVAEGVQGFVYSIPGEAAWREVAWCSVGEVFIVGLGRGVLAEWLKSSAEEKAAPWRDMASAVVAKRGALRAVAGAYVDMNALRVAMPEAFVGGPVAELARALRVENARRVMTLVYAGQEGGGLGAEIVWSSRSEPAEVLRSVAVNARNATASAGDWGMALSADWAGVAQIAGDVYAALSSMREATTFDGARRRHVLQHGAAMQRLFGEMEGVWIGAAGEDGVVARLRLKDRKPELTPGDSPTAAKDLREVLQIGGSGIEYDAAGRAWSMPMEWGKGAGQPGMLSWRLVEGDRAVEVRLGRWEKAGERPGRRP